MFRLLKMLYPEHDLHSACVGLQSADPVLHDNALEFIDTILPPEMRAVLMPLIDRAVPLGVRIARANQLLKSAIGGREEAVEVLTMNADPWLRSCAAYAIGELRLVPFAAVLDAWTPGRGIPIPCSARLPSRHSGSCAGPPRTRPASGCPDVYPGPMASAAGESGHRGTGAAT